MIRQRRNIYSRRFDIMIDGFQRSANTFAARAFELCQPFSIVVNSHNHNPAAVIAAVRMNKPVLILIREPRDAIASWVIHSRYPLSYCISSYREFYEKLMPYLDRICVAQFYEVANGFSQIIERVNQRFDCKFRSLMIDEETTRRIFSKIESDYGETYNGSPLDELKVSRPSAERRKFKEWILQQMMVPVHADRIRRAEEVYRRFSRQRSVPVARGIHSTRDDSQSV